MNKPNQAWLQDITYIETSTGCAICERLMFRIGQFDQI